MTRHACDVFFFGLAVVWSLMMRCSLFSLCTCGSTFWSWLMAVVFLVQHVGCASLLTHFSLSHSWLNLVTSVYVRKASYAVLNKSSTSSAFSYTIFHLRSSPPPSTPRHTVASPPKSRPVFSTPRRPAFLAESPSPSPPPPMLYVPDPTAQWTRSSRLAWGVTWLDSASVLSTFCWPW